MLRLTAAASLAVLALVALPVAATAQDAGAAGGRLAFTLGAGLSAVPGYFGSDETEAGPGLAFDLGALNAGPLSFGGDPDEVRDGFGFRGSFRYVPGRSSDDYEELTGLEDVDAAFELGGGVRFARPWYEAFAVARYGIGGGDALVGEVGLDLIARPSERLTLRAGPRVLVGSDDYAATYFGVDADDAFFSGLPEFDAEGGILSSGVEVGAEYRFTEAWGVEGSVRYERLQGDAEASPITAEDDQVSASVAVTRRFDFRF